jgi:hypothetical protein
MAEPREEPKMQMVCGTCGSTLVTRDAWAEWDVDEQSWVLASVYDYAFCHACEGETRIEETPQQT